MTRTGDVNLFPVYAPTGELYWLQSDGYAQAKVRAIAVGATSTEPIARDVMKADAIGSFDVLPDGSLVFEQNRQFLDGNRSCCLVTPEAL